MTKSQVLAQERVSKALIDIETAQALLGRACGELSPLLYAGREWLAVGKVYDRVRELWYEVSELRHRENVDLDSDYQAKLRASNEYVRKPISESSQQG